MMTILTIALAAAAAQPPSQARAAASRDSIAARQRDTTFEAIIDVGRAVADARAEADRFRTRAFNDPIGSVLESAAAFRAACQHLAEVARSSPRKICRSCLDGGTQPAFDRYRAAMPALESLGNRCAARLRTRVTARTPPAALHQEAINLSNLMIRGLGPYERRVADVRANLAHPVRRAPR